MDRPNIHAETQGDMRRRWLWLVWCVGMGAVSAWAQQRWEYPTDPEEFVKDLLVQLSSTARHQPQVRMFDGKTYEVSTELSNFEELWNQGAFSGFEDSIVFMVNGMAKRRMRWIPDIFQVIIILNTTAQLGVDKQHVLQWITYVNRELRRRDVKGTHVRKLHRLGYSLLLYNALVWTRGYRWVLESEKYEWGPNNSRVIQFGPVKLLGISDADTVAIDDVFGFYYPFSGRMRGRGGRVLWTQFGIAADRLYAVLPDSYTVSLHKAFLAFDSAVLHYPERLPRPMMGRVEVKLYLQQGKKVRRYPRFISYSGRFQIRNLTDGVHYEGGFGLEGINIMGVATAEGPAVVWIDKGGRRAVSIYAERFAIRQDLISTAEGTVVIYWGDDSIVNSNAAVKIFLDERKVSFNLQGQGDFHPPTIDYYHHLLIRSPRMEWHIDSPTIYLQSLYGAFRQVHFQSISYFNAGEYDMFRGILPYDPLRRLVLMARRRQRRNFDIEEVAIEFGNETRFGIIPLLVNMANEGLIEYSTVDSTITILQRAFDQVDAYRGRIDYDNLRFVSSVKRGWNARLDEATRELVARGVREINVSDSQGVVLYPRSEVHISRHLHILFSGYYEAAMMNFTGDSFHFNYDSFYVWMPHIDSAYLSYVDTLPSGEKVLRRVETPLQDLEGTLYIDSPNNKSGLKHNPQYPIFRSRKGGYAYYDDSTIGDGGYDREKVYFKLDPFNIDSLRNLHKNSFRMRGTFSSGGIFPDFETDLILMDDHSLGFRYETPPEGFELYGQKGRGHLTIVMDKRGLGGIGAVEYLGAYMYARWFLFTEDSMVGQADTFYVAHNTRERYPLVRGTNFPIQWYPGNDTLVVSPTKENPIYAYEDSIRLVGRLIMTPERMISSGSFTYERAQVTAYDYFQLDPTRIISPAADFHILTHRPGEYAMESKNVTIALNLDKKMAVATTNTDTSLTIFPYNQFITTMRTYRWDLKESRIVFDVRGTPDTTTALFISTAPGADSLTINSPYAVYDIDNFQINAYNVRYIEVDDSWVIPAEGKVTIEKGGRLPYLPHATIIADRHRKFHRIEEADLSIQGKYAISGTGVYPYRTVSGVQYRLPVSRIFIADDSLLRADISVPDTLRFLPHPRFQFTGELKMVCNDPALAFDGYIRTVSQWESFRSDWFPIHGKVEATHFRVPLQTPLVSQSNQPLAHGFYLETGFTGALYPRFLQPLPRDYDLPIATTDAAEIYYDSALRQFVIWNPTYDTLDLELDTTYSYRLTADETSGEVRLLSSQIRLLHPTRAVTPYLGGVIQRDSVLTSYYRLDLIAAFDIPLPPELMTALGDSLANLYFDEGATSDNSPLMHYCLKNWLSTTRPDVYDALIQSLEEEELWVPHEGFAPALMFSDLPMMWSPELGMFISIDTPGLAGTAHSGVSQKIFGFVAIRPPESNPTYPEQALYVYLQPSEAFWVFIKVEGKNVGIIMSDLQMLDAYAKQIKKMSQRGARIEVIDFVEKDMVVGQVLPIVKSYYRRY